MIPTVLFCIAPITCSDVHDLPDFTKLSQQSLMKLLAGHLASAFEDEKSNFLDIAEWKGVECVKDGQVTSIKWPSLRAIGLHQKENHRQASTSAGPQRQCGTSKSTGFKLTSLMPSTCPARQEK